MKHIKQIKININDAAEPVCVYVCVIRRRGNEKSAGKVPPLRLLTPSCRLCSFNERVKMTPPGKYDTESVMITLTV